MQQSIGVKRFALNHFASTALAFGMLVSSVTVVATLGVTGDLPSWDDSTTARVTPRASAADAEPRQLAMERNEFLDGQQQIAAANASIIEHRQLRMERNDLLAWQQQFAQVPADAEQRQLRMERNEFLDWQKALAGSQ